MKVVLLNHLSLFYLGNLAGCCLAWVIDRFSNEVSMEFICYLPFAIPLLLCSSLAVYSVCHERVTGHLDKSMSSILGSLSVVVG